MKRFLLIGLLCMAIGGHFAASADVARQAKPKNVKQQLEKKKLPVKATKVQDKHCHKHHSSSCNSCEERILHVDKEILKIAKQIRECACQCSLIRESDFKDHSGVPSKTFVISEPGKYCLESNIDFAPANPFTPAIRILSDNVTIDLSGFTFRQVNSTANIPAIVIGNDAGTTILNNIIIQNGTITKFTGVGIYALNSAPSKTVVPYTNLQFLDLNILEVGTSVAPVANPYTASGINLDSPIIFEFQGAPLTTAFAYSNVLIKRCNINNCLGNIAVNVQPVSDAVIVDSNANDFTCNFSSYQLFDVIGAKFAAAWWILGDNIAYTNCQGNRMQYLDPAPGPSQALGLGAVISSNLTAINCQFNDTFGVAAFTIGTNVSGTKNVSFAQCQFNNTRAGINSLAGANALHCSDLAFQTVAMSGKFVDCQFNGASSDRLNGPAQASGPVIITAQDVTFERCSVTGISTNNTACIVRGFSVQSSPSDPIALYGQTQNINFIDCIVSGLNGGSAVTAYNLGSVASNRAGVQSITANFVLRNCIAERISSFSTISTTTIAGIVEALPAGAGLSGMPEQNINLFVENCRISDVHNTGVTTPSTRSAGILVESVQRPVIEGCSVSDCDRGVLFTGTNLITPNNLFQLATSVANATANPPVALDLSGNSTYSTGTASQSGITVQGFGTAFTTAMVGGSIAFSPVSGTAGVAGNIVTATAAIFTNDMVGSTVSFPSVAYSSYIVQVYSPTQAALSTVLPAASTIPAGTPFTVNFHAAPIAAVDVTNQRLTVLPAQTLPQQAFVITYGAPGGNHTFTNTSTSGVVSLNPPVVNPNAGANIDFTTDAMLSNINLNTANAGGPWVTGNQILYNSNGNPNIANLISGNTYSLIVYIPGFTEGGVIQDNEVDNCKVSGYQDNRPVTTTSTWINNKATNNGTPCTDATNYAITWSPGPAPIDSGFIGGPYPTPGNKYNNLSLKP